MALADRDPSARPTGRPCSVAALLDSMPDDDAETLRGWLANVRASELGIWQELKAEGYTVGRQQIGLHRRGQCRCATG